MKTNSKGNKRSRAISRKSPSAVADALRPTIESRPTKPQRAPTRSKTVRKTQSAVAVAGRQRSRRGRTTAGGPASDAGLATHAIINTARRNDADNVTAPMVAPQGQATSDVGLANLTAPIHESALATLRISKALVDHARTAGQRLKQAQAVVGEEDFDQWGQTSLGITPEEATALLQFVEDPAVLAADVSPATAVPLPKALRLVGRLCRHFS